ncbi:JmjC domain-containing histone demethylation protein 1 [Formica fusca]|uniref:jmjC domain-containing histone demethylation protein 1-like isoform X1 n=1 Tax=Formica exsecta TaxID=72781 RepID=UPI001142697A|nr:jmjC domain-containing histone demethylation protein 1-like isoform X1 [Formica exsecta]XP_029660066.1 jmjC domain-containing histone demethylation protein 1-like isoform X2 [Formica exsecta]
MADESAPLPKRRQLRERTRKLYTDDWTLGDEEIEGRRTFQLDEKIECERYDLNNFSGLFREMTGPELNLMYLQKYGLQIPLLFKEKSGLGLRVPSSNFSINDVRTCVGSKRILDVMDVNTQKNEDMTMKEWQKYYEDSNKERLLNVISLEFSHTKLENYVQSPALVRQVDWVDVIWPRHLKDAQVESTNLLEDMMYPKVQKYCLMSVKGCYTDFHVDFGGTSVWYHILRGGKIFWLIPPTEKNLALYQEWVLSGKQSDVFFGDMVDRCGRISLTAGMTLFIPTGWIHAVYTPQDSLVFGGNFLHSFGIEKQLKVAQVEEHTKVPQKFRYPFFTEMLWYVLERYVHVLLGRTHLEISESQRQHSVPQQHQHIHITPFELHGLKAIVMYLHSLPSTKKNVPELIRDPVALIHDVRCLVEQHRNDNPEAAVTGSPVLPPPPPLTIADRERMRVTRKGFVKMQRHHSEKSERAFPRRRRTRCKKCEACTRQDCRECVYCQDMVKFGGSGRAKQTCLMRQCLRPMLPVTSACKVCQLDGWKQPPAPLMGKPVPTAPSNLMECSMCFDIVHPECIGLDSEEITVNDDLPNSWECPQCCERGRNLDYRPRQPKARARKLSVSSAASSAPSTDSERAMTPSKRSRPDPTEAWNDSPGEPAEGEQKMTQQRIQLAMQLIASSSRSLAKAHVVVRPAPAPPLPIQETDSESKQQNSVFNKTAMLAVFRFLDIKDLLNCALVCRTWARYSIDPGLWKKINMSHYNLRSIHLTAIIRRQPESLSLDWTKINKMQLAWLLSRLPQLRTLSLQGCTWSGIRALKSCSCPPLETLNLSYVTYLNDAVLQEVLDSPTDSRPGLIDKTSRLKHLKNLSLAGCDLTDRGVKYIIQHLLDLETLDLSSIGRLTDSGVAQLTSLPNLASLNLANCKLLTETTLDHLARCKALKRLDLRHTTQVSTQAVIKFAAKSEHNLHVTDVKLVEEKKIKTEFIDT